MFRWGAVVGAFCLLVLSLIFVYAADADAANVSGTPMLSKASQSALLTDDHPLLCEAVLTPTASEYIEVANPTSSFMILDDYYVSDDLGYALLPGQFGDGPAPPLFDSDFIAQLPSGAFITPEVMIVSPLMVLALRQHSDLRLTMSFMESIRILLTW